MPTENAAAGETMKAAATDGMLQAKKPINGNTLTEGRPRRQYDYRWCTKAGEYCENVCRTKGGYNELARHIALDNSHHLGAGRYYDVCLGRKQQTRAATKNPFAVR